METRILTTLVDNERVSADNTLIYVEGAAKQSITYICNR